MMDFDVAVIGSGPAGIQAGIHASRKKAKTIIIGKQENSALYGAHVENLFGAPGKADGSELLNEALSKAESFGCTILNENVISAGSDNGSFILMTESVEIRSKTVILAPGIHRNKVNVPGEKELLGKGVSYCASCDCNFYKGKTVAIVGDESEAAASAELMTRYAGKTYWITDAPKVSEAMIIKAGSAGVLMVNDTLEEIAGSSRVEKIILKTQELAVDGVFIELGGRSSADLAMDLDIMPEIDGTIKVDQECRTSVKGVFACGDVTGKPWQAAKAVGQGAVAGINAADMTKVM
jgi:Thioredoxin reductase